MTVKFVELPVDMQWSAMRTGRTHVQIEVWQDSMAQDFGDYLSAGHIASFGEHQVQTREDWWYPEYVETQCPGLPDWRALQHCPQLFADENSNGLGVYYKGPWGFDDAPLIRGLSLPFEIRTVDTGKKLWEKLQAAYEQKKPILLLNWTPNWINENMNGKFVEFPPYSPECETDPRWGINANMTHDCGNPKNGWLKKAGWPGLKNYSPCAADILQTLSFNRQMIEYAATLVVVDGHTEEQAAELWLTKYADIAKTWTSSSCNKDMNRE